MWIWIYYLSFWISLIKVLVLMYQWTLVWVSKTICCRFMFLLPLYVQGVLLGMSLSGLASGSKEYYSFELGLPEMLDRPRCHQTTLLPLCCEPLRYKIDLHVGLWQYISNCFYLLTVWLRFASINWILFSGFQVCQSECKDFLPVVNFSHVDVISINREKSAVSHSPVVDILPHIYIREYPIITALLTAHREILD